jgi:phosphatidylinositol-3-phosphatase
MASTESGRSVLAIVLVVFFAAAALAQVPTARHVVLVIDENHSFSDVMDNMPWLVAQGNANGYAAKYQSDNGGSLLDYLWLASGSCESSANCSLPAGTHNFYCNGNDCYYPGTSTSDPITDDNIFREMNRAGISWKVYAQSYAKAGGTVTTPDNRNGTSYYRRHNGAVWYSDILSNVDGSADKIVDLSQLPIDLASENLPRFMIIVPDGNHDAHDCPVDMSNCSAAQELNAADQFLSDTLGPILKTSDFQPGGTGLAIVTFDECGGGTDSGCGASIYTALIGPKVKPHTVSDIPYKHENALRTMLDSLGIKTYPGAAARAADMSDFFSISVSKPEVIVTSPTGGASLSSPVEIQAEAFPSSGHAIIGWHIYVDSVDVYWAGAVNEIRPSVKMSTGAHTVVVRTWDSSGAYGDQIFSVTVSAQKPVISVLTPLTGADVGSPVNLIAAAIPPAGHTISGWHIYVDSADVYGAGAVNDIHPSINMSSGPHAVVVRAWDSSGAYGDRTLNLTVSSKPAMAVSAPSSGANVNSPIPVRASATPSSGHSITGWRVYLDSGLVYKAGAVDSINTRIPASTGTHSVVIRAWDTSGAYADRYLSVDVQRVAVNISTPFNGAPLTSPVSLKATAGSANAIVGWHVYVDSVSVFAHGFGSSISTDLTMAPGTHTVVVRAWDSTGAYGSQTIQLTVP